MTDGPPDRVMRSRSKTPRRTSGGWRVVEAFSIRSFRFQWTADAGSTWAAEMETLILGWYLLVETNSPLLVGLLGALRFGGTLLSPIYGVLADRVDRRAMLIAIRIIFFATAATIMILGLASVLEPWHILLLAAVVGLTRTAEHVVRQSLIADVVPGPMLVNAIGLSRTTQDTARIAGALAGAWLLTLLGIGSAYVVVVCFYGASVLLALGITAPARRSQREESPLQNLKSGMGYVRGEPVILAVMFLAFIVNFTAFPVMNGLMPVVARDIFHLEANGLARFVAISAVGAFIGSVAVASFVRVRSPEQMMVVAIVAWHLVLLVFARTESTPFAMLVLAGYGLSMSVAMVTMSIMLLSRTPQEFRGRVMGVRSLAVYGLPMGLLVGGFLFERLGVQATLTINSIAGLVLTAVIVVIWPVIIRGRPRESRPDDDR